MPWLIPAVALALLAPAPHQEEAPSPCAAGVACAAVRSLPPCATSPQHGGEPVRCGQWLPRVIGALSR